MPGQGGRISWQRGSVSGGGRSGRGLSAAAGGPWCGRSGPRRRRRRRRVGIDRRVGVIRADGGGLVLATSPVWRGRAGWEGCGGGGTPRAAVACAPRGCPHGTTQLAPALRVGTDQAAQSAVLSLLHASICALRPSISLSLSSHVVRPSSSSILACSAVFAFSWSYTAQAEGSGSGLARRVAGTRGRGQARVAVPSGHTRRARPRPGSRPGACSRQGGMHAARPFWGAHSPSTAASAT